MTTLTRREFLRRAAMLGLSASAVALLDGCGTLAVPAPTPTPARIPRIGFLSTSSPSTTLVGNLVQGLEDLGYKEGKNIAFEYRYSNGSNNNDKLPALAAELVALNTDIFVTVNNSTTLAALKASNGTTPIVFAPGTDVVEAGIVSSLAHPGGNITGIATLAGELIGKRLSLFKEIIPDLVRLTILDNTGTATVFELREVKKAGEQLGLQLQWLEERGPDTFESVFASAINSHAQAIFLIGTTNILNGVRFQELAALNRLPVSAKVRENAVAGALMSYGANLPDMFRRGATYIDKILKGRKPADLPVEQPTKFDFAINLKTAKALGITIPQSVLAQATEVIQ